MFRNPTTDLIVVLVVVLLILGPKRLPSLGRSLGQGMREFKDSITGESKEDDAGERPELTRASESSIPTATVAANEQQAVLAPSQPASEPVERSS
jgi:sec-independent protein translocase protein TatA